MNVSEANVRPVGIALENLAAELTSVAYRVALGHGVEDSWMELEIELWRALADTLEQQQQRLPRAEALDGDAWSETGHRRDALRPYPK